MRLNNSSKVTRAAIVATLVLLTAACTADPAPTTTATGSTTSSTTTSSPTTSSPSPTVDPDVAAAEAAILEAYRGYWATKVAILADTSVDPDDTIDIYAIDTARSGLLETLLLYRSNRIITTGAPVLDPVVSDVVLDAPASATITDCVDVANWQPIYRDTRESAAAPGQATRVLMISTAAIYDDRWVIRTQEVNRETPC